MQNKTNHYYQNTFELEVPTVPVCSEFRYSEQGEKQDRSNLPKCYYCLNYRFALDILDMSYVLSTKGLYSHHETSVCTAVL
jgi:hypothetical protein